ncbi:MAG: 4-hydroxybenzoate octaprenyltransferase [Hyphomicrobiaceae bacterium]|nr:4-hydroxybenzoate octaprenyltransferase [Hyphomicrobiaceae bacterium]
MSETATKSAVIADARLDNFVDRHAPPWAKPFLKLGRFDRPIGSWLLLFPCWWAQALAELSQGATYPNPWYLVLFVVGAFVMRGAGCTWNDIVDRKYDAKVARTALRPIPSGQITVPQALAFGVGLSLIGLMVLIQFNAFTIVLAMASLGLIVIYPFSKRYTYWPQVVLGLTFKWGALVGWAAVTGSLAVPPLLLYAGCVLWTIGYDTIYAHQDRDDDAILGLKSTALRFGAATHYWLTGFYTGALVLWVAAAALAGGGMVLAVGLVATAAHFAWQIRTLDIDDPANCLLRFRSNRFVGWLVFLAIVGDMSLRLIH